MQQRLRADVAATKRELALSQARSYSASARAEAAKAESAGLRTAYAHLHANATDKLSQLTTALVEGTQREHRLRTGLVDAGKLLLHRGFSGSRASEGPREWWIGGWPRGGGERNATLQLI